MNKLRLFKYGVITLCIFTGIVFEHFVERRNHPIEQVVEKILKDYGIDEDFSKNKKIESIDEFDDEYSEINEDTE